MRQVIATAVVATAFLGALLANEADALEQFTSRSHVLGFESGGYYVSNGTYALRVSFESARAVAPAAEDASPGAVNSTNASEEGEAPISPFEKGGLRGICSDAATDARKSPLTPLFQRGEIEASPESKAASLRRVSYSNLWTGISVTYDTPGSGIARSTWTLAPGADPAAIRLRYNRAVELTESGDLTVAFDTGAITESRPAAWQYVEGQRQAVEVAFAQLAGDVVGFRVGRYRPDLPLTIDPTVTWSTFLGDSGQEVGLAIAVDGGGNVYVTGGSTDTWGSPVRAYTSPPGNDAFVAQLTSNGTLVWNTFLGGSGGDRGDAIAVDGSDVYVVGFSSATWESPVNAYTAGYDGFAARLTTTGVLTWNTFFGGVTDDFARALAIDAGDVYVVGFGDSSWSTPVSPYVSGRDAFAARLTSAGALSWNTFLGGSSPDFGLAVAIGGSGDVYLAGRSESSWGSPLRAYSSGGDAFAARLMPTGVLVWNTFLGGGGSEEGIAVAVDSNEDVYVVGFSDASWGTPLHDHTPPTGFADAFVAKLTSAGALTWNSFLGGGGVDTGNAVTVDASGDVYVVGTSTDQWGSPVRPYNGAFEAFAVRLTPLGALTWNTFLGGSSGDSGQGIALNGSGNLYVTGWSQAAWGSPVSPFAVDDAFVTAMPVDIPHDSVVLPLRPLTIKIGADDTAVTKTIKVKVLNADILSAAEGSGHVVQLIAADGDCPAGTVAGLPDFDKDTAGPQDSVLLAAGASAKASVTLNIAASAFTAFNHVAPTRCTLSFSVVSPGNDDSGPTNDTAPMEISVLDANDSEQSALHETWVRSLKPVKITISEGNTTRARSAKPAAGNADILPSAEDPGDLITVTATDGDCPAGTVGVADYDKDTVGSQNMVTVEGGKTTKGTLPATAAALGFIADNKKSPARCVATVSVTGPGGDTDASNNTTQLVIDVYDKNDF